MQVTNFNAMQQVFQLRCSLSFMGKQTWHIFMLGKAREGFDSYLLNPEQTHALWLRSEYSLIISPYSLSELLSCFSFTWKIKIAKHTYSTEVS